MEPGDQHIIGLYRSMNQPLAHPQFSRELFNSVQAFFAMECSIARATRYWALARRRGPNTYGAFTPGLPSTGVSDARWPEGHSFSQRRETVHD
jgi:hypothetical protein